jgi:hypothetical protein
MFWLLVISSADKSYELRAASEYDHETLSTNSLSGLAATVSKREGSS